MVTRPLRPSRLSITVDRVLTALTVLIVAIAVLISLIFGSLFLFIVYLIVTVFVVRSVPVEPGAWLGLRVVRRGLVVVIALISLNFLAFGQLDVWSIGVPLFIILALCDLALGRATRRIATAEAGALDERQESLRNRAHRIAYGVLAVSVGLVVVFTELAGPSTRRWFSDSLGGGALITFIQLLFFLPAMVIAWIEPDRIPEEDASRIRRNVRARAAYGMVAIALALPVLSAFSLALAPLRVSAFTQSQPPFPGSSNQTATGCEYFGAKKQAGVGLGATISMSAVACWNGMTAFEDWGMNDSDCLAYSQNLVAARTLECRRITTPDGSLRFTYRTQLRSVVLPFMSRDVVMTLALTKDGKVVQFP